MALQPGLDALRHEAQEGNWTYDLHEVNVVERERFGNRTAARAIETESENQAAVETCANLEPIDIEAALTKMSTHHQVKDLSCESSRFHAGTPRSEYSRT